MVDSGSPGRQTIGFRGRSRKGRWGKAPRRRKPVKGFLPGYEVMEERRLLATMIWANATGGDWDTASNWVNQSDSSDHHVPTATDAAEIDQGGITVSHGSNVSDSVQSLTSAANVTLSAGALDVSGTVQFSSGQFTLAGATLAAATVAAGTTLVGQSGTLDGVTVGGNLTITGAESLTVEDGLTLDGMLTLGGSGGSNWGFLNFSGSQTLGGTGTVDFIGPGPYNALGLSSGTLTIGSGITVQGQSGYIGYSPDIGGSPSNIAVVNQGTIKWANGGNIQIPGTLTNQGSITVDSTSTLAPGGTIAGSTITTQAGAGIGNVTLDGVTLDGDFQVVGANSVTVADGLTLDGTATLGGSGGSNWGFLNFNGSQTLGGTGTVDFIGPGPYNALGLSSGTLTIGSGITVQGQSGYIGYSPDIGGSVSNIAVINQGIIDANAAGSSITIYGTGSQNAGTLEATGGGTLYLEGTLANSATLSVDATSSLSLSGTLSGGTITVAAGATVTGSTLDGVTIDGSLAIAGYNSLEVEGRLTLDGTLTLGSGSYYGYLYFNGGSQTLGGNGTVDLAGSSYDDSLGVYNGTLTIGSGITVEGQDGYVGYSPAVGGTPASITVVNQGTIQAGVSGGTIYVYGTNDQNSGTLEAANGGSLVVEGSGFVPGGAIEAGAGSTLTISASVANDGLTLAPTGAGTVAITGTVQGGAIDAGTGTNLELGGSTLVGVALSGDLAVVDSSLTVEGGLTLDGATLALDTYADLYFLGTQALGGSGRVVFSSGPYSWLYAEGSGNSPASAATLTIAPGVTVESDGENGYLETYYEYDSIVNQGTIEASASGETLYVSTGGTPFANSGTLMASGGTLRGCEKIGRACGVILRTIDHPG